MEIQEYQEEAYRTAVGPAQGDHNLIYHSFAMMVEAGEFAGKVQKAWEKLGVTSGHDTLYLSDLKSALAHELGDILWHLAATASALELDLDLIAEENIVKLLNRQARGLIHGTGDNR